MYWRKPGTQWLLDIWTLHCMASPAAEPALAQWAWKWLRGHCFLLKERSPQAVLKFRLKFGDCIWHYDLLLGSVKYFHCWHRNLTISHRRIWVYAGIKLNNWYTETMWAFSYLLSKYFIQTLIIVCITLSYSSSLSLSCQRLRYFKDRNCVFFSFYFQILGPCWTSTFLDTQLINWIIPDNFLCLCFMNSITRKSSKYGSTTKS